MTGPIVVGVDGTPTSASAASTAATLASALGTALHVVCAYDRNQVTEIVQGSDRWVISSADDAETTAQDLATRLGINGLSVVGTAALGKPAEALVEEAERLGATMIVVGNRRVQGISRVLGSVAAAVAHRAPCDVYVAKTV